MGVLLRRLAYHQRVIVGALVEDHQASPIKRVATAV
jgi:hypothetical protein